MAVATCSKCGKTMDAKNFYTHKDGSKTSLCKKCLTMHINNFEEDTFTWILKDMDVPYVPEEWNVLRDRAYAKDPTSVNTMSVLGKYLSKMKLTQWKKYGWADSEAINLENKLKKEEAERQAQIFEEQIQKEFERGDITEAQYKTLMSTQSQVEEIKNMPLPQKSVATPTSAIATDGYFNESNFIPEEELIDPGIELTKEDRLALAIKWGRLYKDHEWVELERTYNNMMKSFDIQDADSKNTLILICKVNLKANQALDCGDYDGFKKLSTTLEAMRKSAKFTAAQNKEAKGGFVDAVGQLVEYCEKKKGKIPEYDISEPEDIVDKIIMDLKEYNKDLIYADPTLAAQIEDYLKKRAILDQKKLEKLLGTDKNPVTDDDYAEYLEQKAEDIAKDREIFTQEAEEDES